VTPEDLAGKSKRWIVIGVILLIVAAAAVAFVLWQKSKTVTPTPAVEAPKPASPQPTTNAIPIKSFAFDLVTTDDKGAITNRSRGEAKYFSEDLGTGITLDMVLIPAGNFLMGSPDSEKFRFGEEGPQRNVAVPAFYMGKFEITQAQWQAVASLPKIKLDLNPSPSNFEGVDRPIQNVTWMKLRSSALACQRRPDGNGDCRARPNGNMRAGPEQQLHFIMAKTSLRTWPTTTAKIRMIRGREGLSGSKQPLLEKPDLQMHSACTTCTEICGNGVLIRGMKIIALRLWMEASGKAAGSTL